MRAKTLLLSAALAIVSSAEAMGYRQPSASKPKTRTQEKSEIALAKAQAKRERKQKRNLK